MNIYQPATSHGRNAIAEAIWETLHTTAFSIFLWELTRNCVSHFMTDMQQQIGFNYIWKTDMQGHVKSDGTRTGDFIPGCCPGAI